MENSSSSRRDREPVAEELWQAHPDLSLLGKRLRAELDETLRAEQHAARISARRRSSMRDRLLMAEDSIERLSIEVVTGSEIVGTAVGVGADHVVVAGIDGRCVVAIQHIVAVREPA